MRAYLLAQNLLILDEPFGSSDDDVKDRMYELCTNWIDAGKNSRLLVFTSHDPDDARKLKARTLHLHSRREKGDSTWRLE
jgi:ABC-type nitrate/sulfonate/bicarbonate transport system ATPase subunit